LPRIQRILADPRPGSGRAVIGSIDGAILVLDDASDRNAPLRPMANHPQHEGYVHFFAFHPLDPDRLYSGGADRLIKAWDLGGSTDDPVLELTDPGSPIASFAFDATGDRMLAGAAGNQGSQNVAQLWEAVDPEELDRSRRGERARFEYLWKEAQRRLRQVALPPGPLADQIRALESAPDLTAGIDDEEWAALLCETAVRYRRSRGPDDMAAARWLLGRLAPDSDETVWPAALETTIEHALVEPHPYLAALLGALVRTGDIEAALDLERDLPLWILDYESDPASIPFAIELHCFRALLHARPGGDMELARESLELAERVLGTASEELRRAAEPFVNEARDRVERP
jgi:hypothetical protein